MRYGSKLLEFAKGKSIIELNGENDMADALRKVPLSLAYKRENCWEKEGACLEFPIC